MDIPRPDNFNETYLYEGTFFYPPTAQVPLAATESWTPFHSADLAARPRYNILRGRANERQAG